MAVNRYFLDLSDRLVEMTDTMAMLASHNEQLLQFVGLIATAQPMLLDSWHAEQLLLQIGHPEYTHACQECHGVPAFPTASGAVLCRDCAEEEDHV